MWLITNESTADFLHLIPEKQKYLVGRVSTDLLLRNDTSISRQHAYFELSANDALILCDSGSKYGTYHNKHIESNTKLAADVRLALKAGDTVRFGLLQNVWRVEQVPLVTVVSSLPEQQLKELQKMLKSLGGRLETQWRPECTHLTMPEFNITNKVLHAMLDNTPIVSPAYWREMLEMARLGQLPLPAPADFKPPLNMALRQKSWDLGYRAERKRIFVGKTFVFMHRRHLEAYGAIVEKAGGSCKSLLSGVPKSLVIKPNVIVVQFIAPTESQSMHCSQTLNNITDYLQANGKRIIPEHEIGLAILHCSTAQYCNPAFKLASQMPSTLSVAATVENEEDAETDSDIDIEVPETAPTQPHMSSDEDMNSFQLPAEANKKAEEAAPKEADFSMPRLVVSQSPAERPTSERRAAAEQEMHSSDDDLFNFKQETDKKSEKKQEANELDQSMKRTRKEMECSDEEKEQIEKLDELNASKRLRERKKRFFEIAAAESSDEEEFNAGFLGNKANLFTSTEKSAFEKEQESKMRKERSPSNESDKPCTSAQALAKMQKSKLGLGATRGGRRKRAFEVEDSDEEEFNFGDKNDKNEKAAEKSKLGLGARGGRKKRAFEVDESDEEELNFGKNVENQKPAEEKGQLGLGARGGRKKRAFEVEESDEEELNVGKNVENKKPAQKSVEPVTTRATRSTRSKANLHVEEVPQKIVEIKSKANASLYLDSSSEEEVKAPTRRNLKRKAEEQPTEVAQKKGRAEEKAVEEPQMTRKTRNSRATLMENEAKLKETEAEAVHNKRTTRNASKSPQKAMEQVAAASNDQHKSLNENASSQLSSQNLSQNSVRRKRAFEQHSDSDEDDAFNFIAPSKRQEKPNVAITNGTSTANSNKTSAMNNSKWITTGNAPKSQTPNEPAEAENALAVPAEQHSPVRRGRLAVIRNDDSDDDEDDLFNFGDTLPAMPAENSHRNNARAQSDAIDVNMEEEENVLNTSTQTNLAKKPSFIKPEPKPLPKHFANEASWICKKDIKQELKSEQNLENTLKKSPNGETTVEEDSKADIVPCGFIVQFDKSLVISSRSSSEQKATTMHTSTNNNSSHMGKPNFKAFVKKNNFIPQSKIIKVVQVPIYPMRRA